MSEATTAGDDNRLQPMEANLPNTPDHEADVEESDQPEPEEVSDAVLDQ